MTRRRDHDYDEREPSTRRSRHLRGRAMPFVSLWIAAWIFVPALGTVAWLVRYFDPTSTALLIQCVTYASVGLALVALGIGKLVTGRVPFVYWHVAVSVAMVGFAIGWFCTLGWDRTWCIIYFTFSLAWAGSWMLYRIDALRARGSDKDRADDGGWGAIFGLAKTKVGRPKVTDHVVEVELQHHGGETTKAVQHALPNIESAAGTIAGRGRVVPGERANTSTLTLVFDDPFMNWLHWPGLSHPGGSFTDFICSAYYENGEPQRFWFPAGVTAQGQNRPAGHLGRMGITGSGKTGDQAIELAEAFSRRDVVVVYADATKGAQSVGWCLDFLTLFADSVPKAKALHKAMHQLVRDRAERFGQSGFRDWTPECYTHPELRDPAVLYVIDEGDELINSESYAWLCTKARSVGVFISTSLPRADGTSMPTKARYSIGSWKCFGVGDDYSASFALTDETRAAGAHPEPWKATITGAQYLDSAPGVESRLYAVPCRTYRAEHADLRAAVLKAREGFEPATLSPRDLASLGSVVNLCDPLNRSKAVTAAPINGARLVKRNGGEMTNNGRAKVERSDEDDGEGFAVDGVSDVTASDDDFDDEDDDFEVVNPDGEPGDAERYAAVDPRQPIKHVDGPNITFEDDIPRPTSAQEMSDEFDRVLREMADEGITDFYNRDVRARCKVFSESWLSRRLSGVANGDIVNPPGITLERYEGEAGHYKLIYEAVMVGDPQ